MALYLQIKHSRLWKWLARVMSGQPMQSVHARDEHIQHYAIQEVFAGLPLIQLSCIRLYATE